MPPPKDNNADLTELHQVLEEAAQAASKMGELVVDLPGDAIRLRDGATIRLPAQWVHPAVGELDTIKWQFLELARESKNPGVLAAAHILAALTKALKRRDTAGLAGVHRWARSYIRAHAVPGSEGAEPTGKTARLVELTASLDEVTERTTVDGVLDSSELEEVIDDLPEKGASVRPLVDLASGFEDLTRIVAEHLASLRDEEGAAPVAAMPIARVLAQKFYPLVSLQHGDNRSDRIERIAERVRPQIEMLAAKYAAEPIDAAAREIAERLLRMEFVLSGKSKDETDRAFAFLEE